MTTSASDGSHDKKLLVRDVYKNLKRRKCLACGKLFPSRSAGNRRCSTCENHMKELSSYGRKRENTTDRICTTSTDIDVRMGRRLFYHGYGR